MTCCSAKARPADIRPKAVASRVGIVEPDRQQPEDQDHGAEETDALPHPEPRLRSPGSWVPAVTLPNKRLERLAHEQDDER